MQPSVPPALVLATLLASAHAFLFHAVLVQPRRSPIPYWLAALIGFGLGQLVAELMGTDFLMLGDVHPLEGTAGAWLLLSAVNARQR